MADVEKSAVLKVDVEFGDLEKNQERLISQTEELRNELLKLDTTTKEGQKAYKENAATLKTLEQQQKLNQKAIYDLTAAEKASTDQKNFANNSIRQNRELLKGLSQEYIRIQNPTKEQTARVKELTDTLKSQESAIGDNRRSVGGYAEAFRGVISTFPAFSKGLEGLSNGFRSLSASNPFTAIFLILPPLIDYLSQFENIFDAIEKIVGGVGGAIRGILDNFTKLLSLDFQGFSDAVSEAATSAYNLVAATQDLEDAQRAFNVESAKTEAQVKNLIIQSKDRTKSEQERLAILSQASKLEEENFKKSLAIAQEEKRIADEELSRAENGGKANDALRDRAAAAEIKLIQLQSSSADLQEKISVRRNALIESENTTREQSLAKRQATIEKEKAAEEAKTAKLAEEIAKRNKLESERLEQQQAFADFVRNQEIEGAQRVSEQKILKFQQDQSNRQRDYELFLQNEVLTADTQKEFFDARINQQNEYTRIALQNEKLSEEQKKNIIAKNSQAIRKIEQEEAQARIATQQGVANGLANLSTILGDNSKLGKQLAIASTLISTYTAAQQAYASQAAIPVVGPALGVVAAGAAIAAGLQRVRKIESTKVEGFATGGIIKGGTPISRSNGDNVLITAKKGEVILNQPQQNRLGASALAAAGVPGFAGGGLVGNVVNAEIESVRQSSLTRDLIDRSILIDAIKSLNIKVAVTEINEVSDNMRLQAKVAEL